jgi:hypothetical protein
MDVSKKYNKQASRERFARAYVRQFKVAVVHVVDRAGEERQGVINYKACANYAAGLSTKEMICDVAHRWSICLGAFCVDEYGRKYLKSLEFEPNGIYKSDSLAGVMKHFHAELLDGCNSKHVVGKGWIAIPDSVSLTEEQAFQIFEACGGWSQQKVAA